MLQHIKNQEPFQVLSTNFSISPSNEGYDLQISSDGFNYSTLFSVGAGITRMVTGVSNGSYFRLLGNESEVVINWNKQCNGGGGGGGEYILPIASESTLGGVKVGDGLSIDANGVLSSEGGDSHILLASSATPAGVAVGDVFAIHGNEMVPAPTAMTVSSFTITFTGEEVRFKLYCEDYGGYKNEEAGINSDGTIASLGWGVIEDGDNFIILGPWSNHGIVVSIDGSDYTFTTQNPEDSNSAWMYNLPILIESEVYKIYQAVSGSSAMTFIEYAKVSDLPTENQLLPTNGGFNSFLRMGGEAPEWVTIRQVNYGDGKDVNGKVLKAKDSNANEYGWGDVDNLTAVSALPETCKDGNVYALASGSTYGIYQAQSGTTEYEWKSLEQWDTTPFTQVRFPYVTNDAGMALRYTPEGASEWQDKYFIWNGSEWSSSFNIGTVVDGEWSGEDNGMTATCVHSGDYLIITFTGPTIELSWNWNKAEARIPKTIPNYVEYAKKADLPSDSRLIPDITEYDDKYNLTVWDGKAEWIPPFGLSLQPSSQQFDRLDNRQTQNIMFTTPDNGAYVTSNDETVEYKNLAPWREESSNLGTNAQTGFTSFLFAGNGVLEFYDVEDSGNTMQAGWYNNNWYTQGISDFGQTDSVTCSGHTPAGKTIWFWNQTNRGYHWVWVGDEDGENNLSPLNGVRRVLGTPYITGFQVCNWHHVTQSPDIWKIKKISQSDYDDLVSQSAVSETTLYIIL